MPTSTASASNIIKSATRLQAAIQRDKNGRFAPTNEGVAPQSTGQTKGKAKKKARLTEACRNGDDEACNKLAALTELTKVGAIGGLTLGSVAARELENQRDPSVAANRAARKNEREKVRADKKFRKHGRPGSIKVNSTLKKTSRGATGVATKALGR